ncbi:MAG: hypothetical protein BWY57_03110 [Betaproteobacteria bacterium ADurb.Bin341]|nr:MAG: hypothetical protein BWY57_03110 [Betaproteobacteria bacterium ADurb.Bin341]
MKLSIATLLSIPALNAAVPAFATVLGDDFHNPDFELTQSSANAIAEWLDDEYSAIPDIGQQTVFLDVQTPESYMDACRSNGRACDAAKEAFRVCGLRTPAVWCEPVS